MNNFGVIFDGTDYSEGETMSRICAERPRLVAECVLNPLVVADDGDACASDKKAISWSITFTIRIIVNERLWHKVTCTDRLTGIVAKKQKSLFRAR